MRQLTDALPCLALARFQLLARRAAPASMADLAGYNLLLYVSIALEERPARQQTL